MKELNKGTVTSILVHGIVLGGFVWVTSGDYSLSDAGDDAPAGDAGLSAALAGGPVDVSNLTPTPPLPTPLPAEKPDEPQMPPELTAPPKADPTPEATPEPENKNVPDGVPVLERKKPVEPPKKLVQPTPKKTVTPPTKKTSVTAPTAASSTEKRLADMKARMAASRQQASGKAAKAAAQRKLAVVNAFGNGGTSTDAIRSAIGSGVRNDRISVGPGGGGGNGGNGAGGAGGRDNGFGGAMRGFLDRAWQQPTRAEVGGGNPVVTVSFTVAPDGTITASRVTRSSGTGPMDASIADLLKSLRGRKAPPPSRYGITSSDTYQVDFHLRD